MEPNEFELMLLRGENRVTEFKGACPVDTSDTLFLQVLKAILGMSNTADGGRIIVGIEDGTPPKPLGIPERILAEWTYDHVTDCLKNYADPSAAFVLIPVKHGGVSFIEIRVTEFDVVPLVCKKSDRAGILKEGKCYVRSRRKAETVEVQTQEDMRDLIELATTKRLATLVAQIGKAGGSIAVGTKPPEPDELYSVERKGF